MAKKRVKKASKPMAKKEECPTWFNWAVLIVGVLFVLKSFNVDYTFGLDMWAVLITLLGLKWVSK